MHNVKFQTTGDGNTPELPTFGALAVAGAGTEELEELHVAEARRSGRGRFDLMQIRSPSTTDSVINHEINW